MPGRRTHRWTAVMLGIIAVAVCAGRAPAADLSHRIGVGLNWPGIAVKYGISPKWAIEGRYQTQDKISVMGPRIYYVMKEGSALNLLAGVEGDYVTFTGDVSQGSGFAGEIFVGGEYFVARNLSFLLDMGPAYVSLSDTDTSESVSGLDVVLNMGVNYYFGK